MLLCTSKNIKKTIEICFLRFLALEKNVDTEKFYFSTLKKAPNHIAMVFANQLSIHAVHFDYLPLCPEN